MVLKYPVSFPNRLEVLRHFKVHEEEKKVFREEGERKDRVIQQIKDQNSSYREDTQTKDQQKVAEIDQLKVIFSSEIEQLRLQVRDLNAQNQLLKAEKEAEITELKFKVTLYETQIENNAKTLVQVNKQFHAQLAKEKEYYETQLVKEKMQFEVQLTKEREAGQRLANENHDLQSEVSKSRTKIDSLQCTNSTLEADVTLKDVTISKKDAAIIRKDSELEAKARVLQEKDALISGMSEQLTRARECLTSTQQVSCE